MKTTTYTNHAGGRTDKDPRYTQKIQRFPIGGKQGKLVGAVAFRDFQDGVSVEVLVTWQYALQYLRNTSKDITRVFWASGVEGAAVNEIGADGWSWGSWYYDGARYSITAGDATVMKEMEVTT